MNGVIMTCCTIDSGTQCKRVMQNMITLNSLSFKTHLPLCLERRNNIFRYFPVERKPSLREPQLGPEWVSLSVGLALLSPQTYGKKNVPLICF